MIIDIQEIPKHIKPQQRLLGVDLGQKTIGLALSAPFISQSFMCVSSPFKTVQRTKFTRDMLILQEIVNGYQVGGLIFGWPLHLDGKPSRRCQATRQFALNLGYEGIDIPTAFFDERMSTCAVEKFLCKTLDVSRQKRKDVVDKMAAAFILQGALEYLKTNSSNGNQPVSREHDNAHIAKEYC